MLVQLKPGYMPREIQILIHSGICFISKLKQNNNEILNEEDHTISKTFQD